MAFSFADRESPALSHSSSFPRSFPEGQGWSSRCPAHPAQRCDRSLQLHYSPPIEKVIKNDLGITCLIGLQPSRGTHSQGNRTLLKRWILEPLCVAVGFGSSSCRARPLPPMGCANATPCDTPGTALLQGCAVTACTALSPSNPSSHTGQGLCHGQISPGCAPSPRDLALSPFLGHSQKVDAHPWASSSALQEPSGAGDNTGHPVLPFFYHCGCCVWRAQAVNTLLAPVRTPGLKNNCRNSQPAASRQ